MYKRKTQGWLKHLDFILLDVLALQAAFFLAYLIRHDSDRLPYARPEYRILVIMYVVLDILAAAMFNTMHNVMKRGYYEDFVQTVKQVFLVLVAMALFLGCT